MRLRFRRVGKVGLGLLLSTAAALATASSAACDSGGGASPADASMSVDAAPGRPDAGIAADAGTPLSWVDFAITGCVTVADAPPRCRATAPAALAFVTLAPAAVDTWLWSFGDGGAAGSDPSPQHVYLLPGLYDVTLTVAGPGGTAQAARPMRVEIVAAEPGATCQLDAQCAPAGECICGAGEGCAAPLAGGLCARDCTEDAALCDDGQVCADLARGDFSAPWRRGLCLDACGEDADCREGRACRTLAEGGGGWVRGCFAAGLVGDLGDSCQDASGALDGARCASGTCAALGARGVCAAACVTGADCPAGAACADLGAAGGPGTCLARCDAFACDADPWLACEAPGGTGALGFTVDEPAAAGGYCAPRRCSMAADCGPGSACTALGGGSFCAAP